MSKDKKNMGFSQKEYLIWSDFKRITYRVAHYDEDYHFGSIMEMEPKENAGNGSDDLLIIEAAHHWHRRNPDAAWPNVIQLSNGHRRNVTIVYTASVVFLDD